MSSNRYCMLIVASLVLSTQPPGASWADPIKGQEPAISPTPSVNSVSGIEVSQDRDGINWLLGFDYVFSGDPPKAVFRIELTPQAGTNTAEFYGSVNLPFPPTPGAHHVPTALRYPGEGTSDQIVVSIVDASAGGKVLASQRIAKVIVWPTQDERDFDVAYAMIDDGDRDFFPRARSTLERLIAKNPKFDAGYVELARLAMRTDSGPEGLHQAETLLNSALSIAPDSVNAKILLGYVYAHQHRFSDAEAKLVDAARANPPNLWLWTNWGELLEMQGHTDQAIVKYREAIARPLVSGKYFRARESAYVFLLKIEEQRHDADAMESLYEKLVAEPGPSSCYSADYARFKLNVRHDPQSAIDLARRALNLSCRDAPPRQILGLASYAKWAGSNGTEAIEALNQARIFLPAGPMTLYLLASDDSTISAASRLVEVGEAIDQKDNRGMTALALSLQMRNFEATERLLRLGAHPDTVVTELEIPVALLPVLNRDLAAIGVMQRAGVDYSKLRYRDATALDFAKQMRDDALLKALAPTDSTL